MKKHIFIIDGDAPEAGTDTDVANYIDFFTSPIGGCWNRDEITVYKGYTAESIENLLCKARECRYDYCIVVFTGHGCLDRTGNNSLLSLGENEDICESVLHRISDRQLTILDNCRGKFEMLGEDIVNASKAASISYVNREVIRDVYEKRIESSYKAQYILYACQKGECAYGDDREGSDFSNGLLRSVNEGFDNACWYLTIDEAYRRAKRYCSNTFGGQIPSFYHPKVQPNETLIWAINYESIMALYNAIVCG